MFVMVFCITVVYASAVHSFLLLLLMIFFFIYHLLIK